MTHINVVFVEVNTFPIANLMEKNTHPGDAVHIIRFQILFFVIYSLHSVTK